MECWWCQNPESQSFECENFSTASDEGIRKAGAEYTVNRVIAEIEKERIFFETSGGGVTFSGGEPMMQFQFLNALAVECRQRGFHTTLDTTGYCPFDDLERISDSINLFLYDLKIINSEKHAYYTGVPSELIRDNLIRLDKINKEIIVRVPIIPSVTDTDENIEAIGGFVSSLKSVKRIDILPYIRFGIEKYQRLGKKYRLDSIVPPSKERMEQIKQKLENSGNIVRVEG